MVKLFPASSLDPEYIRQLHGPFPQVGLIVTGGIDADNLESFIAARARGTAVGDRFFSTTRLRSGDFKAVEREATRLVEAYWHAVSQVRMPAGPVARHSQ